MPSSRQCTSHKNPNSHYATKSVLYPFLPYHPIQHLPTHAPTYTHTSLGIAGHQIHHGPTPTPHRAVPILAFPCLCRQHPLRVDPRTPTRLPPAPHRARRVAAPKGPQRPLRGHTRYGRARDVRGDGLPVRAARPRPRHARASVRRADEGRTGVRARVRGRAVHGHAASHRL